MNKKKSRPVNIIHNFFNPVKKIKSIKIISATLIIVFTLSTGIFTAVNVFELKKASQSLRSENQILQKQLELKNQEYDNLASQDQLQINNNLKSEIESINKTYKNTVAVYEEMLDLGNATKDTLEFNKSFTQILVLLSNKEFEEAQGKIDALKSEIQKEKQKITSAFIIPQNTPSSNSPPVSGYSRQQVTSDAGTFMVSIITADYSSTKVIVDTAGDSSCANDCPVMPLADYVTRNNAFAGINGSYFCPATYPSCVGKTNSFDLLLMNKNKTYFNSDNNIYSSNPGVIFGGGYIRFVTAVSQWGRDTSIDSMISNYPLMVFNGDIVFGGDDDPKKGSKGARSFVAQKGNNIHIGVVHNATVAESAHVMKALGMENALNLDNGGSTALWSNGYKVGPGRNLPNAILFIRR